MTEEEKKKVEVDGTAETEFPTVTNNNNDDDLDVEKGAKAQNLSQLLKTNKPATFGRGMIQLYAICGLVYLTATMSGYDSSMMSSINALPEFLNYFNLQGEDTTTGLVFSIFNIGTICGSTLIWIQDFKGRRMGMMVGCIGVVVSTIIMSTATNLKVLIASRFLLAFFTTIAGAAGPVYCVEMAPPQLRGTVSGLFNTLWYLGSVIAAFSILGCNIHIPGSHLTFRVPMWLQMLCPGIVLCGLYFLPETPRWLIAKDRHEEARAILVKYHANGDENHPIVDLEMAEMVNSLEHVGLTSWKTFLNVTELFSTRADRYRLFIIVCISWFGQFSGNNVSSYYFPKMMQAVGITSNTTQILMNALYGITGWIAATVGARLHDKIGRRKMFMGSTIGMSICMAVVAGTTAGFEQTSNHAFSSATIAFIFIFGIIYALAFTSMMPIYPGEVASTKIRARSMFIHQLVGGVASFVNQFAAPVAMTNIKYWFYVFYVFWDLFETVVIYFYFVETKGRTLEELEYIFEAKNPRKTSTNKELLGI